MNFKPKPAGPVKYIITDNRLNWEPQPDGKSCASSRCFKALALLEREPALRISVVAEPSDALRAIAAIAISGVAVGEIENCDPNCPARANERNTHRR
jgi:hypothetical protein